MAPITFAVDTHGSLAISLATPPFTTNCKPASMGGPGITGDSITLERAAGGCAAVTFLRSRGATQLGTYTVNCSSPSIASCIETDETLTVPSLESGSYTIHVRGKVGPTNCWTTDASLEVPTAGRSLIRTLALARQPTPGC